MENFGSIRVPNEKEKKILEFAATEDFEQNFLFATIEEALAKSKEINERYGDISFVVEDRGQFAVKFDMEVFGKDFPNKFKPEEDSKPTLNDAA